MTMKPSELNHKLASLSTTHFCDASPHIRIFDANIRRFSSPSSWAGRALTVVSDGDLIPVMQAIELANEGDVLVITSETQRALAGEIFSTAAQKKGIAGIVIDGYCRDISSIQNLSIPFYAKGTYPAAGTKHKLGKLNCPIVIGNITITPEDIIFGDDSGLIAMSEAEFHELLPIAIEIKNKELHALELLAKNKKLSDIFNIHEHTENLRQQKPSTLKWS